MDYLKIYNGNILTPNRTIKGGCIIIADGKIKEAGDKIEKAPKHHVIFR